MTSSVNFCDRANLLDSHEIGMGSTVVPLVVAVVGKALVVLACLIFDR